MSDDSFVLSFEDSDSFVLDDDSDHSFSLSPVAKKKTLTKRKAPVKKTTAKSKKVTTTTAAKTKKKPRVTKKKAVTEDEGENESDNITVTKEVLPVTKMTGKKRSVEEVYKKVTQHEHVLLRPDTYIGSTDATPQELWVWDKESSQMVKKEITFAPGLYKIFDEILVNAADNKQRDPSMSVIKVVIDIEKNCISVENDGKGIPIQMHKKENMYVPEMIFGHLLTSSNYDDQEKKVTGGRNGYGAKLANIFSTKFVIETLDQSAGKKYEQIFTDNMTSIKKPKITNVSAKRKEFTRVTFYPDLKKFGMEKLDRDICSLLEKRVYDVAGCNPTVKVYLNGSLIPVRTFRDYCRLYLNGRKTSEIAFAQVSDRWEVCAAVSDGQFEQVSFVNSINTIKGGTHVNHVMKKITDYLVPLINKSKNKGATDIKSYQVRNYTWVFVRALIVNPGFDSQTKETLTTRVSSFGSRCNLDQKFLSHLSRTGIKTMILDLARLKAKQQLDRKGGRKTSRLTGIPKLDDANQAGTRNAHKCTLILTEGDSAKTLAVSGLGVVGRDLYGVFPLRGKLLNVREASNTTISKNAEITAIKRIMGLQHNKDYSKPEERKKLRYGHLMIMTDQDHDGSHIKGLVINFLHHFWPELLRVPGFLVEFITPIVTVTKGRTRKNFYTIPEYETWKEANLGGRGWKIKYLKGLGSSSREDAKLYFRDLVRHKIEFDYEGKEADVEINKAFSKKEAEARKRWLLEYEPGAFLDQNVASISYSDFINKELILFSRADCARSIPCIVDGLKPGQRKILYAAFKRNLTKTVKVATFSGYVIEHAAYHHGDASLNSTLISLAHDFVGSNNINLFYGDGQFGSRRMMGKDAASARYISCRLDKLARRIFPKEDDPLLNYLDDDGQIVEPEYYVPIIPMILVNGAEGIGTGWSTSIPNHNPKDVLNNLRRMLDGKEPEVMQPWYRGFTGDITPIPNKEGKYKVYGVLRQLKDTTFRITELPLRRSTQDFKEILEVGMTDDKEKKKKSWLSSFKEYHTDSTVDFRVELSDQHLSRCKPDLLHSFHLMGSLATSNMNLFNAKGRISYYENTMAILKEYYELRLRFYKKRKDWTVENLRMLWERLSNQARFITMVIEGKLVLRKKAKAVLLKELAEHKFLRFNKNKQITAKEALADDKAAVAAEKENEVEDPESVMDVRSEASSEKTSGGYDYLLRMPLWSLTLERVKALLKERDEKEAELKVLLATTPEQMWRRELDAFEEAYDEMMNQYNEDIAREIRDKEKTPGGKVKDEGVRIEAFPLTASGKSSKRGKGKATVIKKPIVKSTLNDEMDPLDSEKSPESKKANKVARTGTSTSPVSNRSLEKEEKNPATTTKKTTTKKTVSKKVTGKKEEAVPMKTTTTTSKKKTTKQPSIVISDDDEDDSLDFDLESEDDSDDFSLHDDDDDDELVLSPDPKPTRRPTRARTSRRAAAKRATYTFSSDDDDDDDFRMDDSDFDDEM